jgi:hypothetical protein
VATAAAADAALSGAAPRRPPPKAVQCVLPVWGYDFVRQFLELGLPTLLAPGNVPALAAALPTRFIILTKLADEDFIRHHPAFRRLCETCPAEIHYIDHLVTGWNYSASITLAYAEVVRAAGAEMLDTCFFLLVSDYIVADGSLKAVLDRMLRGTSGVLVGNFQIVSEEALPWLQEQLNRSPAMLALSPRELLRWALNYPHPATVANMVNVPFNHNSHTNRLFWRVDVNTLLGRFYLMHMIAIRPETRDFVIASSCDYSFIPEMCPSNNVEVITDSDEYLVVEMQARDHESRFLEPGPLQPTALARTLSDWTTARQRENSTHSVVFHAEAIPDSYPDAVAEADRFIDQVRRHLSPQPKPHLHHPYWRGAIAGHRESTGMRLTPDEWRSVLGLPGVQGNRSRVTDWLVKVILFAMFGQPPRVRLGHPRWPDYRFVAQWLEGFLSDQRLRLLLACDRPSLFTASLTDGGERVVRVSPTMLLAGAAQTWAPLTGVFDLCLVELREAALTGIGDLIDRLAPMMKQGARMLVVVYNDREENPGEFGANVERSAPQLVRRAAVLTACHYVPATRFRYWLQRRLMDMARRAHSRSFISLPLPVLRGAYLGVGILLANGANAGRTQPHLRRGGIATSAAFILQVDAEAARTADDYSSRRAERERERRHLGLPAGPQQASAWQWTPGQPPALLQPSVPAQVAPTGADGSDLAAGAPSETTREPQYADCVAVKDKYGLTQLGLITNQVWHDDPRRVTFILARYKFVAKMLSGRSAVAEVGCGDAFGSRVVQQEVGRVDVYDFDPVFIEDVRQRQSPRWPLNASLHDIITGPLPRMYDGIYSLDVAEHITRADEDAYVRNLRDSLNDEGVLIIGSPSLESQHYASPQSKIGHVNCKSGTELKSLLERYFHNVFLFSMNDEVVHTGFYPMAHYLIAVSCGKKPPSELAG